MAEKRPLLVVTGSGGLVGSGVVRALAGEYRIVGMDLEPPSEPSPAAWIGVDLTDDASVARALRELRDEHGSEIASVFHLAAYVDFSGEDSPLYRDLTVGGTRRLLRGLRDFRVEQLVFSSTMLVHKPAEGDETLTEESPLQGEWAYPQSKIEAERVLREERGSIPVVCLRLAGLYDEDGNSPPLAQQIARIRDKELESYFFPGDASHGQPFVHRDDVEECFSLCARARRRLAPWEVFLIAEPEAMSYHELQDVLGELIHGKEWPTIRIPAPAAKVGAWVQDKLGGGDEFIKPWMIDLADAHYPVSIGRARERLGWEPKRRLREVLPEMIARMKRDPAGWDRANGLS